MLTKEVNANALNQKVFKSHQHLKTMNGGTVIQVFGFFLFVVVFQWQLRQCR